MAIINTTCTNCGASLKVNAGKKTAECPYCNSSYIVEEAKEAFNITNNYNISITTIISGDIESIIETAKKCIVNKNWKEAYDLYKYVTKIQPNRSTGYIGCMVAASHNFDYTFIDNNNLPFFEEFYQKAQAYSDDSNTQMLERVKDYISKREAYEKEYRLSEINAKAIETQNNYNLYKSQKKTIITILVIVYCVVFPLIIYLSDFTGSSDLSIFLVFAYISTLIVSVKKYQNWNRKNGPI